MRSLFRFADWPLRAKMGALFLIASLVPLGIATFINIGQARNLILSHIDALLAARGDQLVHEIDPFHRDIQASLSRVANLPSLIKFFEIGPEDLARLQPSVRKTLEVWPASDPNIRGVALLDRSGIVKVATEDSLIGLDLSYHSYVREALRGVAVISDIHLAEPQVGNAPTIAYLSPIDNSERKMVGVVVFWIRASALWDIMKSGNELAGPGSFAVLFDHQGIRVGHSYNEDIVFHPGGPLAPATVDALVAEHRFGEKTRALLEDVRNFPEQFQRALAESPDQGFFRGFAPVNQKWNYGVGRRFATVPWTIFYMIPEDSLNAQLADMVRQKIAFACVIALLALVAGALFAAVILRPIRSLTAATRSIAHGDLGARVRINRSDELGHLGVNFNSMAGRIEEQATDLRGAHDELEQRVRERTAELSQTTKTMEIQSAALNAAANAIAITDPQGAILWVNPAFTAVTGYSPEEAIGRAPWELVKSDSPAPGLFETLRGAIFAGNVWHGELACRRKDGSVYPEELTITPVKDAEDTITHFIAIARDLTEEKRLETQFLQAQKMEVVGRLAGGIAHDFNNLLTVIIGTADLAVMDLRQHDPMRNHFRQIREAAERAGGLTRQLLAFSRKQMMQMRVLDLGALVGNMEKMLPRLIGENIELIVTLAKGLGSVKADPGQIEQVIMNLVVNARDAMPNGGALRIETQDVELDEAYAATHPSARPGPHVMLAVSDTGVGMDEATRQKIFEPFFTTKDPGKGTGLGLATVYGIVKQSDGNIWVYSEPGRGTTFKIYLPRVDETARLEQPSRPARLTSGAETVLLVEDEEMLRFLAARILQSAGYTVLTAANGAEALLLLERNPGPVNLLLTDMVMPGISGRSLAAQVTLTRPSIKVLYMSGYTDDTILSQGELDSLTHFIGKPYTVEELTRKVRETLDEV